MSLRELQRSVPPLVLATVVLLLLAFGRPTFSPPPDGAAPAVILDAYLQALVRGDCSAGQILGTASFGFGNGELCGATFVRGFTIDGPPAEPNSTEVVFATSLETTGTADGSVQAGRITWFYSLRLQPDTSWKLTGGGSGP